MAVVAWEVRPVTARPARRGGRGGRGQTAARRRLAALAAALVLGTAVGGVASSVRTADTEPPRTRAPGGFVTLVVSADDTIWSLVAPHVPVGRDLSSYVAEVLAYNDVRPADLQAGTVLRLPIP